MNENQSKTTKLAAGDAFPAIEVAQLGGSQLKLGTARGDADWQMIVVYRGAHCPKCTQYLDLLKGMAAGFVDEGIDVVAVSADTEAKAVAQTQEKLSVPFDIGYGLTTEQMQRLGLYISHPRSPKETDRPFAEPGLFVVNQDGQLHVVDISNNPFVRPELKTLLGGLKWIRNPDNNYPIRGTYPNE